MPRGRARKTWNLLDRAAAVLEAIQPATVRAVCYKLFTLGVIPDMARGSTNRVSRVLVTAREEGYIPWDWIVDETRAAERIPCWEEPAAYAEAVVRSYRRDRWQWQPRRVEVWSEKGTVRGTLWPVLAKYAVPFRVFHGYSSATALYEVARETQALSRPLLALYVGDFDPSGLDMSEVDLPVRLSVYGANVELRRIALTPADVGLWRTVTGDEGLKLPDFPASQKRGDPRYRWYVQRYGPRCWELDALDPVLLRQRVEAAIRAEIDLEAWARCERVEQVELASLKTVLQAWHGGPTPTV